jgi:methionyl aminopeptidase
VKTFNQPKSSAEITAMREGGKLLATLFAELRAYVQPGMTERAVDAWAAQRIKEMGAEATYRTPEVDFPGVICISTGSDVVHGVPSDDVLKQGDLVGFDLVIGWKGMKVDSAFSMVIGEEPKGAKKHLLSVTERSLYAGIDAIKGTGARTGDIAAAIEKVLTAGKLGIVRELVGHGIGHSMHEAPDVPNYGRAGSGAILQPGMTIAIEPMTTLGGERIKTLGDGWTIATKDGSLAAHFEHTVLITEDGAEILTTV